MHSLLALAAAAPPAGPFVTFIGDLSTLLQNVAFPVGMIGVILGLLLTVIGYHHGSNVLRTSLVAGVIGLGAKVAQPWLDHWFPGA